VNGKVGGVSQVQIRAYQEADAAAVVALWNGTVRADKADQEWYVDEVILSKEAFDRISRHPNHDPEGAFTAWDSGRLVGYARAAIKCVPAFEGDDGDAYLEALVVDPDARRKGIGSALLAAVEAYASGRGLSLIRTVRYRSAAAGICVVAGTPEAVFLQDRGFGAEVTEMRLHLEFGEFSLSDEVRQAREALLADGIEIRYYEPADHEAMRCLMARHFQVWWGVTYGPSLEQAEPRQTLIAVDTRTQRVAGFAGYVDVFPNGGTGMSPGVDPDYRGRSIGKVLCNVWGDEVKRMGATHSRISTGLENEAAKAIYFGMGYRKIGEFHSRMSKRLNG
jgi:ribosomal protein S18 acetylase RimI-like enzyme